MKRTKVLVTLLFGGFSIGEGLSMDIEKLVGRTQTTDVLGHIMQLDAEQERPKIPEPEMEKIRRSMIEYFDDNLICYLSTEKLNTSTLFELARNQIIRLINIANEIDKQYNLKYMVEEFVYKVEKPEKFRSKLFVKLPKTLDLPEGAQNVFPGISEFLPLIDYESLNSIDSNLYNEPMNLRTIAFGLAAIIYDMLEMEDNQSLIENLFQIITDGINPAYNNSLYFEPGHTINILRPIIEFCVLTAKNLINRLDGNSEPDDVWRDIVNALKLYVQAKAYMDELYNLDKDYDSFFDFAEETAKNISKSAEPLEALCQQCRDNVMCLNMKIVTMMAYYLSSCINPAENLNYMRYLYDIGLTNLNEVHNFVVKYGEDLEEERYPLFAKLLEADCAFHEAKLCMIEYNIYKNMSPVIELYSWLLKSNHENLRKIVREIGYCEQSTSIGKDQMVVDMIGNIPEFFESLSREQCKILRRVFVQDLNARLTNQGMCHNLFQEAVNEPDKWSTYWLDPEKNFELTGCKPSYEIDFRLCDELDHAANNCKIMGGLYNFIIDLCKQLGDDFQGGFFDEDGLEATDVNDLIFITSPDFHYLMGLVDQVSNLLPDLLTDMISIQNLPIKQYIHTNQYQSAQKQMQLLEEIDTRLSDRYSYS